MDVADLRLAGVEALAQPDAGLVVIAKHLCGAGTDVALRCAAQCAVRVACSTTPACTAMACLARCRTAGTASAASALLLLPSASWCVELPPPAAASCCCVQLRRGAWPGLSVRFRLNPNRRVARGVRACWEWPSRRAATTAAVGRATSTSRHSPPKPAAPTRSPYPQTLHPKPQHSQRILERPRRGYLAKLIVLVRTPCRCRGCLRGEGFRGPGGPGPRRALAWAGDDCYKRHDILDLPSLPRPLSTHPCEHSCNNYDPK